MFNLNKVRPPNPIIIRYLHVWIITNLVLRFLVHQVKLHFTDGALRLIAKKAIAKNTGARGLRAILETILLEAMYEVGLLTLSVTRCNFLSINSISF